MINAQRWKVAGAGAVAVHPSSASADSAAQPQSNPLTVRARPERDPPPLQVQPANHVQIFKSEPEPLSPSLGFLNQGLALEVADAEAPGGAAASNSSLRTTSVRPILQSCQFCRKRKIKCDKLEGGCTQCARAKTRCVYPVSQRKGRPRRAGAKNGVPAATPREAQLLKKIWKLETAIDSLTGRGGQGVTSSSDRNTDHPLRQQLDRLVVGKSYVSDTFWSDEVKDLPEESDDEESFSEVGEENLYPIVPSAVPGVYRSGFIFGVDLADEDLTLIHPQASQIPLYWDLYIKNCEKILSLFHKPTTAQIVHQAQEDVKSLSKEEELLMFSIYYATVNSMRPDDVYHSFGVDKGALLTQYENAIQRALVRVGFLNTQNLTVLQAFVLYLICIRRTECAIVWSLTGLAIRLSQGMNIDRDGEIFHLSPLQTELRRRIWHQISILDVRASEAKGCFPTPLFYDTKLPTNINDEDISAETREFPNHRDGVTDMTIALLRYETCEIGRRLRRPGLAQDAKEKMITDFREQLDAKYLQHCRRVGGLYSLSDSIASVVISRMLLMLYKRRCEVQNQRPGTRDQLFRVATELLEFSYDIQCHPDGEKWDWILKSYVQWHAVDIVLHEILSRPPSSATSRAWHIIDITSPDWEVPRDRTTRTIYNSVSKLLAQAQQYRATYVQQQRQQQQYLSSETQHPQARQEHQQIHPHVAPQQQHQHHPQHQASMSFPPQPVFSEVEMPAPGFYVPPHDELYVNQSGTLDDPIGVAVVGTQGPVVAQQTWYVPMESQSESQHHGHGNGHGHGHADQRGQGHEQGRNGRTHPLSPQDQNMVYGPDETWNDYTHLLKNYSMHGGMG